MKPSIFSATAFTGLQRRLLLLLMVALLPVFGFFIASTVASQRESLAQARLNVQTVSHLSALGAARTVEGAQQLLNAITSGPSLKGSGLGMLCAEFLTNIRNSYPYYTNLGFLDMKGNLSCDTLDRRPGEYLGDRAYFNQALSTRSFAIGEYQMGQISGRPLINFGMPVNDNQGAVKGVAFAALDLSRLALGMKAPGPAKVSVALTDRKGTILGTDGLIGAGIGSKYADPALYTAMGARPSEAFEALDAAGEMRIYSVATVDDDSGAAIFVVASIARQAVTAPAERKAMLGLLLLTLLTIAGLMAARWIGNRTLVAPAQRLLADMHRLAGDGFEGFPGLSRGGDEVGELTSAFNRVATVLKLREDERDRDHAVLQKVQERLLGAQRIARIGNWEFHLATRRLWWSEQTYRIFGLDPALHRPTLKSLAGLFFPEDRERCELAREQFVFAHDTQRSLDLEYRIVTSDGSVRWVHELAEMQFDADGHVEAALGTVQDITERVRSELLLASEARALKALSLGLPISTVLEEVLIGMESLLPGARASVHLLSVDEKRLERGVAPNLPPAYMRALEGLAVGPVVGSCGTAAHRREDVIVGDIDTDPLWAAYRDLARAHGLRACWSIPVQDAGGKVLATFAVYYLEPRLPHPLDLDLAHGAAHVIGIAVERDLREAALRVSEQRFRSTFFGAATGVAITTLDGQFVEFNSAYCRMLGYTANELYGMSIRTVIHPDDLEINGQELRELREGKRDSFVTEKRYLTKGGKPVWIRVSVSAQRDALGQPQHVVGIAEDIDLQRQVLDQLREVQNLLDMATRVSHVGAWQVDLQGPARVVQLSDIACAIHGLAAGSNLPIGQAIDFYVPEDRQSIRALFEKCAASAEPFQTELRIVNTAGNKVWVRSIGEAVRNAEGMIVRVQGAIQDISLQKQTEADKAALETRLTTTLESIGDGFATIDRDWRFTFVNAQAEKLLRRSRSQLLGQLFEEAFPVVEGTSFVSNYLTALRTRRAVHFEEFYPPLGMWLELSVYPSASGLAIYFSDVSDQRAAKEQLRLLETAVSRLNDMVLITEAEPINPPGPRIVFVNDAFERRTGFSRAEVIGRSPSFLQGPGTDRRELDRIRASLEQWEPVRAELINYTKAGEAFWIELDIVPIAGDAGRFTHWVAVERDITGRKRAEEEILQLNTELEDRVHLRTVQLEAANKELEAFSYSVSHDLRSPLNTINGFGQLLQKSSAEKLDDKGRHYLDRIQAGSRQMGELIDGLLLLAKLSREPLHLIKVDLSLITQQVERQCRERDPDREVRVTVQSGLLVNGDATLLLVVMQNLFDNAWKYTEKRSVGEIEVGIQTAAGGETVYFVKDNGAGFDMAYADKLFGVFQRLHAPSEFPGTGVGLANVKRVIERHGGRVWAQGQPNVGATFYFILAREGSAQS